MRRSLLTSADSAFGYRPALDGVRTIAVYLVVVFHAGLPIAENGFIGVDLFFVLSGFLVTNVLLGDIEGRGRLDLRRFYARRMRRLLPASAVVILVTALAFLTVAPVTERLDLVADARASALYVANWHFIGEATDYFATEGQESPYLHFWSLAIEEQFYLVFPLVLVVLARLARRHRRAILVGLAALAVVGVGAQLWWAGRDDVRAYYGTDARLYQLLVGAVVAVALRTTRRAVPGLAGAGVVVLVALATPLVDVGPSVRGLLAAFASLAIVAGLEVQPTGPTHAVLSRRTMVGLGKISYGTYLWHWPLIVALDRATDLDAVPLAIVAVVGSTLLAAVSSRLVEMPVRRARSLDAVPRRVIAGGLAISVLVAVVTPIVLRRDVDPVLVGDGDVVSESDRERYGPVPDGIDWARVRGDDQDDLPPFPLCGVGAVEECTVVEGRPGGERILLVGDSHARMLLPVLETLARDDGATLMVSIELGCPWIDGVVVIDETGVDRCTDRGKGWSTSLVADLQPSHVVLVQRELRDVADPIAELTRATLRNLLAAGVDLSIVEPVPEAPDDPIDCLAASEWVASCLWEVDDGPTPSEMLVTDVVPGSDAVRLVDLDRIACPELPVCSPYLDGAFVRRDEHHVQPSWWSAHEAEVRRELGL